MTTGARHRQARTAPLPASDNPRYARTLRGVFGMVPSGVVAVCGLVADEPQGMVVSTFVPVSLDPPLVGLCIQRTSTTWPQLTQNERLGVSLLAESHGLVARRLAARVTHRLAGLSLTHGNDGAIFLQPASAWLECSLHQSLPAGDHVFVMMEVHATAIDDRQPPLVFHRSRFHGLNDAGSDPLAAEPTIWDA